MKYLIATAAVLASLVAIPVSSAEARSHVDFSVGIGVGGFYPGYGGYYGVYAEPRVVGISCGQARNIVRGNGFYKVTPIDCSAPSYRFVAWQGGYQYRVRVNSWGNITGVSPL